jgi:hypothetical protein
MAHPIQALIVATAFTVSLCSAQEPPRPDFVVSGKATHQQFGKHPILRAYAFSARTADTKWSLSVTPTQGGAVGEILVVGKTNEVFIIYDYTAAVEARKAAGHSVGPNGSEVLVLSNGVPSAMHAPVVGAIWLTYLSASVFRSVHPDSFPTPIPCGTVSGGNVAPLGYYQQKAHWTLDLDTGLPTTFESFDDGVQKDFRSNLLVRGARYPRPFHNGFTNIVFSVRDRLAFGAVTLPSHATLDVWRLALGSRALERTHSFTVTAKAFSAAPQAPIPEPEPPGLASITDLRLGTSNGPVLLHYTSNRFLDASELTQLPSYKRAVLASLEARPGPVVRLFAPYYFWAGAILTTAMLAVLLRSQRHSVKHKVKSTPQSK